jgi:hypothetical protein
MISGERWRNAGFRRQVRRGRANRLHAGLLVVRDDCLPLACLRRRMLKPLEISLYGSRDGERRYLSRRLPAARGELASFGLSLVEVKDFETIGRRMIIRGPYRSTVYFSSPTYRLSMARGISPLLAK